MDQSTHDIRRTNWLNIVNQCQERPANVSVRQWLADNGIKEKAYYYWLRKFRKKLTTRCRFLLLPSLQKSLLRSFPFQWQLLLNQHHVLCFPVRLLLSNMAMYLLKYRKRQTIRSMLKINAAIMSGVVSCILPEDFLTMALSNPAL